MPARLNLFTAHKTAPVFCWRAAQNRPASYALQLKPRVGLGARHGSSTPKIPEIEKKAPPNEETVQTANHINEKKYSEAPASPELEQGTLISEILARDDEEALKHMPKVMQAQVKKVDSSSSSGNRSGTRGFSTSARVRQGLERQQRGTGGSVSDASAAVVAEMISKINGQAAELHGLKFPMPDSLPPTENFRTRYDTILRAFTNMLMRDGKKAQAQRNMSIILDYLRASPPPVPNPSRRLLPDGLTPTQLPLDPVRYLNLVVASVAPLITVKNYKGMAGGGRALPVPFPLGQNERRRIAIQWIISASEKRRDSQLANRVAQEIVAVAEGRSSVWERREAMHKNGTAARANGEMLEMRKRMTAMSINRR